ncbi:prolipoprotein diacylglyceryl transferase [Oscillibacter sp. MSJ-2]|uniref:Phosphatidylglycerol--prolipoprotein diacylglyceryl transferase n=1 Tax=Dysosmobacter acutus TaxID=2841504 RepID=A0ABS6F9J9_9FIRM|nr:prolipoprotein diacylglyceryl transferase [Dysosmobacter acutus]MBU5626972.1 prolipoprotein diacylglyceryl transferase [Dysosmobacter acutus]
MTALKDMPISFPGLFGDWEFTASPKMLNIGHGVYWYGFLIALGLMVALWFCMKQSKRFGITEDNVLDLVLWGTPAGILGARLYYVIFYWSLFQNADGSPNWGKIVAIWDGGLAIYGTVIAAFLTAFVYCRHKKIKLWAMTDLCVMGLLIGQAIGRWGNFMNREAFGAETTLPWRMRLWTSAYRYIEVHPTFFYESLWNVVGLLLIFFVITKARRFDGENTCFYFLWYGLGRLWIEGLRTDSLYLFDWMLFGEPIRVSQALSLVVAILAAFFLVYHIRLHPHDPADLMVNRVASQKAEANTDSGADTAEPAPEEESHVSGEEDADGDLH